MFFLINSLIFRFLRRSLNFLPRSLSLSLPQPITGPFISSSYPYSPSVLIIAVAVDDAIEGGGAIDYRAHFYQTNSTDNNEGGERSPPLRRRGDIPNSKFHFSQECRMAFSAATTTRTGKSHSDLCARKFEPKIFPHSRIRPRKWFSWLSSPQIRMETTIFFSTATRNHAAIIPYSHSGTKSNLPRKLFNCSSFLCLPGVSLLLVRRCTHSIHKTLADKTRESPRYLKYFFVLIRATGLTVVGDGGNRGIRWTLIIGSEGARIWGREGAENR